MIYHRCKCGKSEAWESGMPPQPCDVCEACGSTLAWSALSHQEPIPHEWVEEWDIHRGEPRKIRRCQRCHRQEPLDANGSGTERTDG